jgi:phenylalanyl-tRNA synthetase beta chain
MKGLVLAWLRGFGVTEVQVHPLERDCIPFLHPGASAYLFAKGQVIGWIGELHPEVALAYDLEPTKAPLLFELDMESVLDASSKRAKSQPESHKFPPSTRDLALLVSTDLTHDAMASAIAKFPQRRHLHHWRLFDVFQGEHIPKGKKSVAWSFSFRSSEKTLTDQDVDGEFKNLTTYLTSTFQAEQR